MLDQVGSSAAREREVHRWRFRAAFSADYKGCRSQQPSVEGLWPCWAGASGKMRTENNNCTTQHLNQTCRRCPRRLVVGDVRYTNGEWLDKPPAGVFIVLLCLLSSSDFRIWGLRAPRLASRPINALHNGQGCPAALYG